MPQEARASKSTPQTPVPARAGFGHSGTPSALRPSSHTQRPKTSWTWPFRSLSGPPLLTRAISLERSAKRPSEDAASGTRAFPPPPRRRPVSRLESAAARPFPPISVSGVGGQHNPHPGMANPTIPFCTFLSRGHRRRRSREQEPEREDLGGRHAARGRRRGTRGGPGLAGGPAERGGRREPAGGPEGARRGTRESASRGPWQDAPRTGRRRELAEGLRTLGARRGGADKPDLAAPPPGAGCGLLTSARRFSAMSHRPGFGGGGEGGKGAGSPPPPLRGRRGATSSPGARPAPSGHLVLLPAVAGWGREGQWAGDSLRGPLVATEKV